VPFRSPARMQLGAVALLSVLLLTGCVPPGSPDTTDASTSALPAVEEPTSAPGPSAAAVPATSATAIGDRLAISPQPGADAVQTLSNPQESGAPLTLLVVARHDDWLEVSLPQRPNGSTGWVREGDVALHALVYSLEVSTGQNTLTLRENAQQVKTYPVATGTGGTPTPHGSFFLTELIEPTNEGYGPYAFGVSAFSEVLTSFGGGPGQIGLHGTDDEGSIGQSASHGCIRMSNDDITELAGRLPLGTPITIGP